MLESKTLVPSIYSKSRDFSAILKLLDLIINNSKIDSDTFTSILNPDTCPSKLLPLLASYVGYEYDYLYSYEVNRNIIKHYRELINYRGSEQGIRLAALLSVNIENPDVNTPISSLVDISFDRNLGIIEVSLYYEDYLLKINDLLEIVKPAGIGYKVIFSDPYRMDSQVDIDAETITATPEEITADRMLVLESEDDDNGVGFTEVGEMDELPT
jgi:phage tail-like protein